MDSARVAGAARLLDELERRNVRLTADGTDVRVSAPAGTMTAELRGQLAGHKQLLLAHLRARERLTGPMPRGSAGGRPSAAQRALWLLDRIEGPMATYVVSAGFRLRGPLDTGLLTRCLDTVVSRHEALRTAFPQGDDGLPRRVVLPPAPAELTEAAPATRSEAAAHITAVAGTPFDLEAGRLYRARLLRHGPQEHLLVLAVHHIVADAASLAILVEEIFTRYTGERELPEVETTYSDIVEWESASASPITMWRHAEFWRGRLAGSPPLLEIPADRPRQARRSCRGAVEAAGIGHAESARLAAAAADLGTTLYVLLLTAWAATLARYSGAGEVVIGAPVSNRGRAEARRVVGFLVNTIPVRVSLAGQPAFGDVAAAVRRWLAEGLEHSALPFEQLVAELNPERSLGHSPVFQTILTFHEVALPDAGSAGLAVEPVDVHGGTAKMDLTLSVAQLGGTLHCTLEYATDLFDAGTARGLLESWTRLLEAGGASPGTPAGLLPMVGARCRQALIDAAHGPSHEVDLDRPVWAIPAEQAGRTPDALAITGGTEQLTFAELEERTARLAGALRGRGAGPGVLVALHARRSAGQVVAMLAVLRAGGAVVALDPAAPPERSAFVLEDSGCRLLLTDGTYRPEGIEVMHLGEAGGEAGEPPGPRRRQSRYRDNLAYVIYTSGSTGRPKGVAMRHGALANLVAWQRRRAPLAADDRTLQFAPLNFDIFVQEIFPTWAAGAAIVVVDEVVRRDPTQLLPFLIEESVTQLFLPYVALQQLAEVAAARGITPPALRNVFTAGEQLHVTAELRQLFRATGARLYNDYGPTEAHVVTSYALPPSVRDWPPLPPVGRPVDNLRVHVLDEWGEPVPDGAVGEVCIAGPQLAKGYLNRPEATAASFVPCPFAAGELMYRSGDLAVRRGADLHFLGRKDQQVKVRGFRVELGEVEAVILKHPDVQEVVAGLRGSGAGQRLLAWIVARPGAAPGPGELREHCAQLLPSYMVPASFVPLDALPLGTTGKVERSGLPVPGTCAGSSRAPRTPLEISVATTVAEVLGVPAVGADDDFFALGGHSLAATRAVLRLSAEHGLPLSVQMLFERPTVAGLAQALELLRWAMEPVAAGPDRAARREGGEL